jgi:hypothetical protein
MMWIVGLMVDLIPARGSIADMILQRLATANERLRLPTTVILLREKGRSLFQT